MTQKLVPAESNFRHYCAEIMRIAIEEMGEDPWFGMEQEYIITKTMKENIRPVGWPETGHPKYN